MEIISVKVQELPPSCHPEVCRFGHVSTRHNLFCHLSYKFIRNVTNQKDNPASYTKPGWCMLEKE
jgi:hypothetical protein